MSEFVTLKSYGNVMTANIEMERPKAEGIECYVIDAGAYNNLVSNVILRVPSEDYEKASELLKVKVAKREMGKHVNVDDEKTCLMCGSDSIGKKVFSRKMECYNCGYEWINQS